MMRGERRVFDLWHSQNQGTRAGTNVLLNAMRGGDERAGIGAPVPHPWSLFGEADNAELRGADSRRLSISRWGSGAGGRTLVTQRHPF